MAEVRVYSRGYLPHVDDASKTQFLTWRLADALPAEVLLTWKAEVGTLPESEKKKEIARRIEAYCDAGHGSCVLKEPAVARIVQETLFEGAVAGRYRIHAWVVMPNHVHTLLTPMSGTSLDLIVKGNKGASARLINVALQRSGRLWQPEPFDRWIRNPEHFEKVLKYIEWNPVKARLCTDPASWSWSSANKDAMARLKLLAG